MKTFQNKKEDLFPYFWLQSRNKLEYIVIWHAQEIISISYRSMVMMAVGGGGEGCGVVVANIKGGVVVMVVTGNSGGNGDNGGTVEDNGNNGNAITMVC
jgi:hypothetical protein